MEFKRQQQPEFVAPVRIGTIMKLIREGSQKTLAKIVKTLFPSQKDGKPPRVNWPPYYRQFDKLGNVSVSAYSSYELGTRTPNRETMNDLVKVLSPVLSMSLHKGCVDIESHLEVADGLIPNAHDFDKLLENSFHREQVIGALRWSFPLEYLGAWVVANYLADKDSPDMKPPYPEEYFKEDDLPPREELSYLMLRGILSNRSEGLRHNFATWLVHSNRFIEMKYAGAGNPSKAAKYFRKNKARSFKTYKNTMFFCAEFHQEGLLFEQPGPAIDAIMVLADNISFSADGEEMAVTVISEDGRDETVTVPALWTI